MVTTISSIKYFEKFDVEKLVLTYIELNMSSCLINFVYYWIHINHMTVPPHIHQQTNEYPFTTFKVVENKVPCFFARIITNETLWSIMGHSNTVFLV